MLSAKQNMQRDDAKPAEAKTLFGMRRILFIELALFFLATLVIDYLFFDGNRFRDVSPHPFWLPVLLISVQYGTAGGLFAAIAASVILLTGNLPQQQISQDFYQYLFAVSLKPMMWLVAAVMFGELRTRQIRDRDMLKQALSESRHETTLIADTYLRLKDTTKELEARIASQMRTETTFCQAAIAISKLNVDEVLKGIPEAVQCIINPKKFSLFLHNSKQLEMVLQNGWDSSDNCPSTIPDTSALYKCITEEKIYLSCAKKDHERILQKQGVLAGPLLHPKTGEVIGMLKIEDIAFIDLNISTVEKFRSLCDWIGTTLTNARHCEKLQAQQEDFTEFRNSLLAAQSSFQRRH